MNRILQFGTSHLLQAHVDLSASVTEALQTESDSAAIVERMAGPVRVIVSNTADQGYLLDPADHAGLLDGASVPRSFPPCLVHLLSDIARNHAEKTQRRCAPVLALAAQRGVTLGQPRLRAVLAREAS